MAANSQSRAEGVPSLPLLDKASSAQFAVVRKAATVRWNSISERKADFAAQLEVLGPCRVAIHADKAENIVAAILACIAAKCELVLGRSAGTPDEFWRLNGVAAVFDADLKLQTRLPANASLASCAILLSTSGTSGTPKLVIHEVASLLGRVKRQQPPGCWLLTYHPASFAGLQVVLTAFCSGSLLVCADNPTVADLASMLAQYEVTHVSGTPTFFRALLLTLRTTGVARFLRQITLGGEIADQPLLDSLHHAFPQARIIHIYASTEAGALFSVSDLRAGFPAEWLTTGTEGCQLRIRDSMLEVRSPRAMRGYVSQPTRFSPDGWLITGDLVKLSGDRVVFLGREDTVINVGGAKVMPEEVENILLQVPGVRDARVYGIKNPISGYILGAEVAWTGELAEQQARAQIFEFLSARLESYKVPRMYRFSFSPKTNEAGKKDRSKNG